MQLKLALALLASAFAAAAASTAVQHWSYFGPNGPRHWAGACAVGKQQSPIDISTRSAVHKTLPPLVFRYTRTALHMIDNGHSIQVDVDKGSTLAVGGVRFPLVQFHFHKPSEEAIDGRHSPMVVHLVHRDAEGNLAVVAVPIQAGEPNALIETLWRNLPHQKQNEVSPRGVTIDPSQLLPPDRSYFTYVGSLTTPPCTEGVRWFVLPSPVSLSSAELSTFAKRYPANARPIQPANGRQILTN